jgi:hypothetical protein
MPSSCSNAAFPRNLIREGVPVLAGCPVEFKPYRPVRTMPFLFFFRQVFLEKRKYQCIFFNYPAKRLEKNTGKPFILEIRKSIPASFHNTEGGGGKRKRHKTFRQNSKNATVREGVSMNLKEAG